MPAGKPKKRNAPGAMALLLAAVAAALLLASIDCVPHGAMPRRAKAARPEFGALAIAAELCALGPRDSGTIGAAEATNWIADRLAKSGLDPVTDTFTELVPGIGNTTFRNVVATIPGTTRKHVLLLSHYDTKRGIGEGFAGANDGASSTALLLALAEWFRRNPPPGGASVTFAFLDGEECISEYGPHDGLHGSRRLAAQLKAARTRLDGAILLDMVGDASLNLTIPANADGRLMALALLSARRLGIRDKVGRKPQDMVDDHQPFLLLGYPAIDLIDFEFGSGPGLNDYWHTPADTIDKLSDESLDVVGALVIEMIANI